MIKTYIESRGALSTSRPLYWASICATAIALVTSPAVAQDAAAESDEPVFSMEEIVITARKRAEIITDIPEAITAFTGAQIRDAGLTELRDFANLTPNLNINPGSGAGSPQILARGLSQAQNGEAPIAVVIDGVQVAHPAFIQQDYGEVVQFEVLRGPQGSLYGRNAIGGALNITTKQPTNDFEGGALLSYANADTGRATVNLSGPIVEDKVLFRIGGGYKRTDGQIRNLTRNDFADRGDSIFVNGRLIVNLSDALTFDLRSNYIRDDIGILSAELVSRADFQDFDPGFLVNDLSQRNVREVYDISGKITYSAETFQVTSITGYSSSDDDNLDWDFDFTPLDFVTGDQVINVNAVTQELRIESTAEGSFRWLAGGFFQDREVDLSLESRFLRSPLTFQPIPPLVFQSTFDQGTSESWAVFGSASYDVMEDLELTIGLRYDVDKRRSVTDVLSPVFVGVVDDSETFKSFQPKIQLAYSFAESMSIYATYSEGFISGGFNAIGERSFDATTAENFEIGFKGQFADDRVYVSASLFRVNFDDQQFFFVLSNPPTQIITNIDKTRVTGAELEVNVNLIDGLNITGGLGITDGSIRRFDRDPTSVGSELPQNTQYTANLAVTYSYPITHDLDLRLYGSYRRQGRIYFDTANTLSTNPKDFVNLRLFVEKDRWSVGIFVENLTKSQFPNIAGADLIGPDINIRIPSSPRRLYGIEASYRF